METTQYSSPREQRELDEATAELESFMLSFFANDEKPSAINFDKNILLDEDDSRPTPKAIKRVKRTKSPTPTKLKAIKSTAVTLTTPTADVHVLLDALQERLADNVKDAELYHPINVEPFSSAKIEAVIDWLDLRFTVDPTRCIFFKEPKARSYIKAFITRSTGTRHYIATAKPQCQILLNNEADSWKSAFYSLKIQINILRYIEPNELTIHDDELENKDMNKDMNKDI